MLKGQAGEPQASAGYLLPSVDRIVGAGWEISFQPKQRVTNKNTRSPGCPGQRTQTREFLLSLACQLKYVLLFRKHDIGTEKYIQCIHTVPELLELRSVGEGSGV